MMRLAILGADDESLELARSAVRDGGHSLVAAYDSQRLVGPLLQISPQIGANQSWEELILSSVADAVIIGRGGHELTEQTGIDHAERRADQLRKLTQAAVPMIVVCPACESIVGFEIEMIRRDTNAVIFPYVHNARHPGILRLAEMVRLPGYSPIGDIEQIDFQREQQDRDRPAVLTRLSRDMTILRILNGAIQTVSASGAAPAIGRDPLGPKPKELPSLANLSIHLSCANGVSARWSIAPALEHDHGRITLTGRGGRAILSMPESGQWSLEVINSQPGVVTYSAEDETETEWLGFSLAANGSTDFGEQTAWLDACRDQEAAEAVDRSLARGRTIELFNEDHTEAASFKGVMAMGGCLLLTMTLAILLLAVAVESLRLPIRAWPAWRIWPLYVLAPLTVFILLQLFQLAVKRESPSTASATPTSDHQNRLG